MQTFRADLEAVNDNRSRSRKRWVLGVLVVLALLGVFGYLQAKSYLFNGLPSLPDKSTMWELNLQPNTTLMDKNGEVIGHRGPYLGRPLKLTEMPRHLPDAFLAIEDERFYQHAGIDRKAILRAFFENSAQRYFGKSATKISLSEAAMLAALPQAPSRLNPVKNYDGAWERGKLVLRRMLVNAMITPAEMAAAENNPPVIKEEVDGELLEPAVLGHVFDLIQEQAQGLIGSKDKDLIIWTTLDPKLQLSAHESLNRVLEKQGAKKKVTEGALVSIDNATVVDLGKRFGITTNLRSTYSLSLGTSEVTLLDLTQAYMVFANEGVRKPPYIIDSINNTSGENLYKRRDLAPQRVYAVPYARQMSGMLRDVIDTGTGYGARLGSRQAGGKTGTSQDYRDAWFIGFSADYTTGVWMGNDDNSQMVNVTGGLLPVDAWKSYNVAAHKGVKRRPLSAPNARSAGR